MFSVSFQILLQVLEFISDKFKEKVYIAKEDSTELENNLPWFAKLIEYCLREKSPP